MIAGRDLSSAQARRVFEGVLGGDWPESAIGALLAALATKGECVDEVVGAASAMRAGATPVRCDAECIDTCGTGGDGVSTFNVSTTAAIIAAAAGATVAKHGNRSSTRVSGSTEVLTMLGIDTTAAVATVERSLVDARIGYLNAQLLHPAMKHAAPVRKVMRTRTIFNLLGPLTNPAGARRQIIGVPKLEFMDLIASALVELGVVHAWVVHGADGLCDLTVTGETVVVDVRDGRKSRFTVAPDQVGLSVATLASLCVASPAESAARVRDVLSGRPGAARDHALMNAGGAMVIAGLAGDLREGVLLAKKAVDDGAAAATLDHWRSVAGVD